MVIRACGMEDQTFNGAAHETAASAFAPKLDTSYNSAGRMSARSLQSRIHFGEILMSAPSRRPEIRRRRTRNEKIQQLRKRLAAAKADADRERITAKLHKLGIGSPGQPLLQ